MTEPEYPAPGSQCICVNDQGWWDYMNPIDELFSHLTQVTGPAFMQQLKIAGNVPYRNSNPEHRLGLEFVEFPGKYFCFCRFRPLIKIEDEVEDETTAPVDVLVNQ